MARGGLPRRLTPTRGAHVHPPLAEPRPRSRRLVRSSTSPSRCSENTPVLQLPEPFANTPGLTRHEISRYDDRGPAWAWNWLEIGEHVGTHFDAPIHWITGRDGEDVASVPPQRLVGPAVVIDKSAEAAADPDYLLTVDDVARLRGRARPAARGRLAAAAHRLGRARPRPGGVPQRQRAGPHTPGLGRRSARAGSPRRRRSSASGSRPSAPTPAPRTASTRRSRSTASCSARASTASPSSPTSRSCRRPARCSSPRR